MPVHKEQHFLPVSYLKGFAFNYPANNNYARKSLQTFVFERKKKNIKKKGLHNIAKQSYLYSFVLPDGSYDHILETEFSKFEPNILNISKGLYDELILRKSHKATILMNDDIRDALAYYISLQFKRTPKVKKNIENQLSTSRLFDDPIEKKNYGLSIMAGLGENAESGYPSFSEAFKKKRWLLFSIMDEKGRFVTSDLPVSPENYVRLYYQGFPIFAYNHLQ
mgnify:CR=1 FL=1